MNKEKTIFRIGIAGDAFEVEGMGQDTVNAAVKHGRELGVPVMLHGFNVPNRTKENEPLEGEHFLPVKLRTKNTFHKERK